MECTQSKISSGDKLFSLELFSTKVLSSLQDETVCQEKSLISQKRPKC